jgi:hydrogenase nickel incorporation protein HypA/HybF
MHELSVCRGLVKQLNQIAIEHHATGIEKIYLQIGPLAGVEPTLLQAAFPVASTDTLAEQAQMFIKTMPIRVHCKTCKEESETTLNNLSCSVCGDWQTELLSGDELLIERVEMQTTQ